MNRDFRRFLTAVVAINLMIAGVVSLFCATVLKLIGGG